MVRKRYVLVETEPEDEPTDIADRKDGLYKNMKSLALPTRLNFIDKFGKARGFTNTADTINGALSTDLPFMEAYYEDAIGCRESPFVTTFVTIGWVKEDG